MKTKKILIACEKSQIVTIQMRKLNIEAYSCDIKPCSGYHPKWHKQCDVLSLLKHKWDMIIAFPPCTHLANSGARWFNEKRKDGRQKKAIAFFMQFINAQCQYIAVENPIGIMSTIYRQPNQIIQPYQFGDPYNKKTCIWLKGLPKLKPTHLFTKQDNFITYKNNKRMSEWYAKSFNLPTIERSTVRSKTFPGIAKAMTNQWGNFILNKFLIPKENY